MGEKYDVPLKNEKGDVIGVAHIDPDEIVGGVIEVEVTDENVRKAFQPDILNLSVYLPSPTEERRFSGALSKASEVVFIKKENKE